MQASEANRRFVRELANRPSVIEALKQEKSVYERLGTKEKVNSYTKSRSKRRNLSVFHRLGRVRRRSSLRRKDFKYGVSPHMRNRLEIPKYGYKPKSGVSPLMRNRLEIPKYGYKPKSGVSPLVRNRLGFPKYGYGAKHGLSPLIREELASRQFGFDREHSPNLRDESDNTENFQNSSQSDDNLCVEINSNRFIPRDDIRVEVNCIKDLPRVNPAGIFNYYRGIRYYGSEVFIWIVEWKPVYDQ